MHKQRKNRYCQRWIVLLLSASLVVFFSTAYCFAIGSHEPVGLASMEAFDRLPYRKPGVLCQQASSYDRTGANTDFGGNFLFIDSDTNEAVMLDEIGPGCVYRIWMTESFGKNSHIRIRVDGRLVVDKYIQDFFSGKQAPFLYPLAANDLVSSGGYYSYVPIVYHKSCRISLTNYANAYNFYNITYHRFDTIPETAAFTGTEDYSKVIKMWRNVGKPPVSFKADIEKTDEIILSAGTTAALWDYKGAGAIRAFYCQVLDGDAKKWNNCRVKMYWDGATGAQVDAPLGEFFGSAFGPRNVRSLAAGMTIDFGGYCFLPMPFWKSAVLKIENQGQEEVKIKYTIRANKEPYADHAGYFHAWYNKEFPTTEDKDYVMLKTCGWGHYVGIFHRMQRITGKYYEGDERIYVDGAGTPALYGTGTEDYYNGGYHYKYGEFALPIHGAPVQINVYDKWNCFRFHLSDWIPFNSGILAGIEHGHTNNIPGNYSSVAFYYGKPETGMKLSDELNVGDPASERAHDYSIANGSSLFHLNSVYEGDNDWKTVSDMGRVVADSSSFTVNIVPDNCGVLLRRRMDYNNLNQKALVLVDGKQAGIWYTAGKNEHQRMRDTDFLINESLVKNKKEIHLTIKPLEDDGQWTEMRYWIYCLTTFE